MSDNVDGHITQSTEWQCDLRFVMRNGQRILQQGNAVRTFEHGKCVRISIAWADVPLCEEQPASGQAEAKAQPVGDARAITFHCGDKTLHLDKDGDTCVMSWQGKGEKRHLAVQEITTPDFGECVAWMRPMVTLPQRWHYQSQPQSAMITEPDGEYMYSKDVLAALTAAGVAWEQG